MGDRALLGRAGEKAARAHLRALGFAILETGYRSRFGEIDIVARDGETLVFVEVKARRAAAFGRPEDAVTWTKRRRLSRMAREYLARHGLGEPACRFDVVSVVYDEKGRAAVELFRGAFDTEP